MYNAVIAYFSLAVSAILASNLVMVCLLCSDTFFKALKSPVAVMKYGLLVTISTTAASVLAWVADRFLLVPFRLEILAPLVFVVVMIAVELLIELFLHGLFPRLRRALGGLLPLAAFNCAVLGLVIINVQIHEKGLLQTAFYGSCAGLGFIFALFTAASAMERVRYSTPPTAFRGMPIAFVTASLISLAFMGFSGLNIP